MSSWTITEPRNLTFADEPADRDAPPTDITRLTVRLNAGRLTVVGTDGPPRVEISRMADVPVRVDLDGGVLTVAHEKVHAWPGPFAPLWWWLNGDRCASDVSIAVPFDVPCVLWLASGSLVVSTVRADVTADCVSGRITLLGVSGALRAKVISGPIEALGCGGDIELETVSGEIVLADSAAGRLRATTVSGALTADLDNPPFDSEIKLETVSGEIIIRVREDSDLRVALSAAHGRVTSDFPGMSMRSAWGSKVSGTLGRGTGNLVANAVGGNIALLRRPTDDDFDARDGS